MQLGLAIFAKVLPPHHHGQSTSEGGLHQGTHTSPLWSSSPGVIEVIAYKCRSNDPASSRRSDQERCVESGVVIGSAERNWQAKTTAHVCTVDVYTHTLTAIVSACGPCADNGLMAVLIHSDMPAC